MEFITRKCKTKDIRALRGKLREEDCRELFRVTGYDPYFSLVMSFRRSDKTWVGMIDGEIACVWGVNQDSVLGRRARIWLLSTSVMDKAPIRVARFTKRWIKQLLEEYDILYNYVDDEYTKCKKWLSWLGFTLEDPEPYGATQSPFCHFYIKANKEEQDNV